MSVRSCEPHAGPASRSHVPSHMGPTLRPLLPLIQKLLLDVGQKPHEAGAFDRLFYRALLLGGEAATLSRHDAAVRIHELLEQIDVFVIDMLNIILCENVCHSSNS